MIDRSHALPLVAQARQLGISRGSIYYLPRPVPATDLAVMRRIDELHLLYPFAGSRMLRDLLRQEGTAVGRLHIATLMKRMRIEAIYRRPNTSKPAPGHKIYPYLLRKLAVTRPNQAGPLTSPTCPWSAASSTSSPSSIGSPGVCWRGGCLSRWMPSSASRRWRKRWPATVSQQSSTAIRAPSSRVRPSLNRPGSAGGLGL
jgi:putative transposase